MKWQWPIMLVFVFWTGACSDSGALPWDQLEYNRLVVKKNAEDFKIPTQSWDLIEGKLEFSPLGELRKPEQGFKDSLRENIFKGVRIRLVEKTRGVLGYKNHELVFLRNGASINLSDYVKDKKGTFYLQVQPLFTSDGEEAGEFAAYFVSNSRKRKLDQQIVGSGCNKYYSLGGYFNRVLSQNGIEVNVTADRHVSLLSGHLIVVSTKASYREITQVTFYDTNRPDLQCERTTVVSEATL